jgi:hypothetical protein
MPEPNLKNDPLVRRVICGGSRNGVERLIAFPCDGNASNESSYKAHAFG